METSNNNIFLNQRIFNVSMIEIQFILNRIQIIIINNFVHIYIDGNLLYPIIINNCTVIGIVSIFLIKRFFFFHLTKKILIIIFQLFFFWKKKLIYMIFISFVLYKILSLLKSLNLSHPCFYNMYTLCTLYAIIFLNYFVCTKEFNQYHVTSGFILLLIIVCTL